MNIYWYISKAKLDLLTDQAPGFLTGIKAQMSFKLPMLEGSLEGTEPARVAEDLQRVVKRLNSQNDIKSFSELSDTESPTLVSFKGPAVRSISNDVFWIAVEQGNTALLLAGSAGFAIGAPSKTERSLSPSADPVGAVKAAFSQADAQAVPLGGIGMSLSSSLSYAWQELMADSLDGTLPTASGLAIFARTIKADKAQMRRIGKANIERIVVGSPIYVEQV